MRPPLYQLSYTAAENPLLKPFPLHSAGLSNGVK